MPTKKKKKQSQLLAKDVWSKTCLALNPHGKLVYAGFPNVCAMLPDVAVAG